MLTIPTDFPNPPLTNGQRFTGPRGATYEWDAAGGVWFAVGGTGGGGVTGDYLPISGGILSPPGNLTVNNLTVTGTATGNFPGGGEGPGLTLPLAVSQGGTQADNATQARTNLGITQANLGGPFLTLAGNQTVGGTVTFNNITVNGTASGSFPGGGGPGGDFLPLTGGTLQRAAASYDDPLLTLRAQTHPAIRFSPLGPPPAGANAESFQIYASQNWFGIEAINPAVPDAQIAWFGFNNYQPDPWFGIGGGIGSYGDYHGYSTTVNLRGQLQVHQAADSADFGNRVIDLVTAGDRWCMVSHEIWGQWRWATGVKPDGAYTINETSPGWAEWFRIDRGTGLVKMPGRVETGYLDANDFMSENNMWAKGWIATNDHFDVSASGANAEIYLSTSNPESTYMIRGYAGGNTAVNDGEAGLAFYPWSRRNWNWAAPTVYMNMDESCCFSKWLVDPLTPPISPWPYPLVVLSHYTGWVAHFQGPDRGNCEVHWNSPNIGWWSLLLAGAGTYNGQFWINNHQAGILAIQIEPAGHVRTLNGAVYPLSSDPRTKDFIGDYDVGLEAICALEPKRFRYNGKGILPKDDESIVRYGVDASVAGTPMPEAVMHQKMRLEPDDTEDSDVLSFDTNQVMWAMVNAIKELKQEVDELKRTRQ